MDQRLTVADLTATYQGYGTPRARWLVGGEYERAVVRADGRAVGYFDDDGIRWVLDRLAERTGWAPYREGEHVIALEGEGASITLEPGGQVELSGAPFARLADLAAEVRRNRDHLIALSEGHDHRWIACGLTPFARIDDIPWVPKGRYAVMREYLPRHGPLAHWMMKGTCSVQANYDYADEADCARKFRVAHAFGPLTTAIFANSPIAEGRETDFLSYRGFVWTRTDPARTGFPAAVRAGYTHARWVDYLLDTPMMFIKPAGRWQPANGATFRQWMQEGLDGVFPTMDDWALHQTSVFPEVRVKRTIEIRGADAVDVDLAVAFCALWAGLLYGPGALPAALELADRYTQGDDDHAARHLEGARLGLRARFGGRPAGEWADELAAIAVQGLREIGEDAALVAPLLARIAARRSPGEDLRDAFRRDPSPASVLAAAAY